ncbi:MAG: NAD(P)-binding protein [Acidimicrobiales bacterium]|nr:NAD(P)-binding protein [Acidimicrobiales bacterium]
MADGHDVDYLVIGAGLAGMAFTDALISETDARVLIVDRRHGPGGHWNDAYPFVRLHQPSAFYGVPSCSLGEDRIDETGPNAGFYERATAAEVCHYFQEVMDETFLPSGQVDFWAMSDVVGGGHGTASISHRLSGATTDVAVRKKVVDARYLESSIPATHTPRFTVSDGARCVPVNDLVKEAEPAGGYVVLGAGKTAMDACVWLLEQGVDPHRITWVKPREPWLIDRKNLQPRDKVGDFIKDWANSVEASARATSAADLFERLEACEALVRIDANVEPTMFRAPILSRYERGLLATIEHVVRSGHVRWIQPDRMVMDDGEVMVPAGALFIDCTAEGLQSPTPRPVFEPGRITPQGIREGSPSFNSALIGYVEATRGDDLETANDLTPPNRYPSTAMDWIRQRHTGMTAQMRWDQHRDVTAWAEGCRLNVAAGLGAHAGEPGVGDAIGKYLMYAGAAIENLAKLHADAGLS